MSGDYLSRILAATYGSVDEGEEAWAERDERGKGHPYGGKAAREIAKWSWVFLQRRGVDIFLEILTLGAKLSTLGLNTTLALREHVIP